MEHNERVYLYSQAPSHKTDPLTQDLGFQTTLVTCPIQLKSLSQS
jgi:hypothetical protein